MAGDIKIFDPQFLLHKSGKSEMSFQISDEAEHGGDATIIYYGYVATNGSWIIQKHLIDEGQYRYYAGSSDYDTNWTGREALSYGLFSGITIGV